MTTAEPYVPMSQLQLEMSSLLDTNGRTDGTSFACPALRNCFLGIRNSALRGRSMYNTYQRLRQSASFTLTLIVNRRFTVTGENTETNRRLCQGAKENRRDGET